MSTKTRSFRLIYPPERGFQTFMELVRYLQQLVRQIELEIQQKKNNVDGGSP